MEIDSKMPLDCPSLSNDFLTLSDLLRKDVFMDE